jgi:membrane-associated protease RseP (regulator of RpoE activity)
LHWDARMRLCSAVLFVALTGGVAVAGSKVPLRVVRVMPDTHQALLYDKTAGTHVLVEQGKSIDGYLVEDIDEDEVTLVGDTGTEIVLAAPDYRHRHDDDDKPAKTDKKPAAPQDPYASASSPQDPYAEPPIAAADGAVRTTEAPAAAAAPTAPTTAPATVTAAPAPAPVTTDVPPPAVAADAPIALARADVNASLANFGKLAGSIHGSFTADGARLDAIAPDSLFAKAGLRNGDVIAAVDGLPLTSLYARAAGVKMLTLSVIRAARPLTLRVVIAQ